MLEKLAAVPKQSFPETWTPKIGERMMDGEALMVLLEWTIHGYSMEDKLGLPASQSKTWLVDRSFWQSWVQKNEPQRIPPGKGSKWVCMEEEPVLGTEVVHDRLRTALDARFSEQAGAAPGLTAAQPNKEAPLRQCVLPN